MKSSKSREGTFGLSYPMLTKTNYTAWAIKMKVFMQAHGVWDAIEPKDPKATAEEKMDKRALAIIYQGIHDDMLLTLAERKTYKEAWGTIKTMCLGVDKVKRANAQTLKAEFESLNMKDTEKLDDFSVLTKFLQIASAIEQFGNLETMSVEEVVGSLKTHEEHLHGQTENSEGQQLLLTEEEWHKRENEGGKLLLTREEWLKKSGKNMSPGGSYYRIMDGRVARDRSQIKCFNCGAYGHFAMKCRKPKEIR
ncbi:uncharacterized protein LOC141680819 [Apium graveolens]|uniref:uncharacterized protein LOC141680819 n=1 Tax=Apium graveolens TaxID=4045 RepID=UPI003D79A717